ncbi:MAG: hypothetical protein JXR70_15555 [Spirochaetales bacterium]|nr:hypothetical protein [Spirochaetales bacterium]
MECKITLSDNKKYVIMVVSGDLDLENLMKYSIEANKIGDENNLNSYLMDMVNARNKKSIADNYDFAYNDMKDNKEIHISARVAYVVAENDHSHDFVETVMINAGYDIKLFRNKEKAIEFLMENE